MIILVSFSPRSAYFSFFFFFFNDTATTEIYTLSLHDALPISYADRDPHGAVEPRAALSSGQGRQSHCSVRNPRSEEHTSELQSRENLVCRLLLEKKKKKTHRLALTSNNPPTSSTTRYCETCSL